MSLDVLALADPPRRQAQILESNFWQQENMYSAWVELLTHALYQPQTAHLKVRLEQLVLHSNQEHLDKEDQPGFYYQGDLYRAPGHPAAKITHSLVEKLHPEMEELLKECRGIAQRKKLSDLFFKQLLGLRPGVYDIKQALPETLFAQLEMTQEHRKKAADPRQSNLTPSKLEHFLQIHQRYLAAIKQQLACNLLL